MRFGGLVLLVIVVSSCQSFEDGRAEARAARDELAACREGDECDIVDGLSDCYGVFECPFAVNLKRRAEAESRARGFAEESHDHNKCWAAFCGEGRPAHCDVAKGKCVNADGY